MIREGVPVPILLLTLCQPARAAPFRLCSQQCTVVNFFTSTSHDFDHHPSSSNSTPAHSKQAACLFLTAKDHRQAEKVVQVKALLPQSYSMMKHPSLCDLQALFVTTAECHRPSHGRSCNCKQLRFTVTGQSYRLLCICIHTALLACNTAISAACTDHLNALLGF